jgi:hypothetical protein
MVFWGWSVVALSPKFREKAGLKIKHNKSSQRIWFQSIKDLKNKLGDAFL